MARLAGVDIPRDKRVVIALTYIYGVGRTRSTEILKATEIDESIRVKDLSDDQLVALRDYIEGNYKVEGDLHDVSLLAVFVLRSPSSSGAEPLLLDRPSGSGRRCARG